MFPPELWLIIDQYRRENFKKRVAVFEIRFRPTRVGSHFIMYSGVILQTLTVRRGKYMIRRLFDPVGLLLEVTISLFDTPTGTFRNIDVSSPRLKGLRFTSTVHSYVYVCMKTVKHLRD